MSKDNAGVAALLVIGALLLMLAARTPQAWATHDQKPLTQTITEINGNPDPPDCLLDCDGPIRMTSLDAPFGAVTVSDVPVYVTENTGWIKDTTDVTTLQVFHTTTVDIVNGDFDPNPALIWANPEPGYFDVFFDVNKNDVLNDGDAILGPEEPGTGETIWVGAGICVDPCAVGGVTVPAARGLGLLWFGVAAVTGLGAFGALAWRRWRD